MASSSLADWMTPLDGDLDLALLTIPGSHDSTAREGGLKAVTQTLDIAGQLAAGIRFFDIRLKDDGGVLRLFHGDVDEQLELEAGVLETMLAFLAAHPGEGLIMSVKQEDAGDPAAFARDLEAVVARHPDAFRVAPDFPRLADVRGRILVFRRFSHSAIGIAADPWKNDATFSIATEHGTLTIEDHWDLGHTLPGRVGEKWDSVAANLDAAVTSPLGWFVTFTSAMSDLSFPRAIAGGLLPLVDGINQRLLDYLDAHPGHQRLGTIVMDFPELPDPRLIQALVDANR
jgi:1-phosphatidylinositol phosphodiesterase